MIVVALTHLLQEREMAPRLSFNDPGFAMLVLFGGAILYYGVMGVRRAMDRQPQMSIDHKGITLGLGRNRRLDWRDIMWVRTRRIGFQRVLQVGLDPAAFVAADLRLSMWNVDDPLGPIRGVTTGVQIRPAGLDTSAHAMLDAVKSFRPNLVKS